MKTIKSIFFICVVLTYCSCACSYDSIKPKSINYISSSSNDDIKLEYKYDLLEKKYAKKEDKYQVKVVALKITNNSNSDITFGKDIKLAYNNGNLVDIMADDKTYRKLKQKSLQYLWYLPLTLLTVNTLDGNGNIEKSYPAGLIIGPGLTLGNVLYADNANKEFRQELKQYDLMGETIAKGESKVGLVGIRSNSTEGLVLKKITN